MLGLLLMAISIIAEISIHISHLQRHLSKFERTSILFDIKMTVISTPNEIFFPSALHTVEGHLLRNKVPMVCVRLTDITFTNSEQKSADTNMQG